MTSLAAFVEWLNAAPDGTMINAAELRTTLSALLSAPPAPPAAPTALADVPVASWRERLWTVPPDTRMGVAEAAEALGRPPSFVYRHTSAKSAGDARLPHRRLDGELVFVAGEIRAWVRDHEETIAAGRSDVALSLSRGRAS